MEAKVRKALTRLASDEVANDPFGENTVLHSAVQQLGGHTCRPHWWRLPIDGDDALVCDECGRRLLFDELTGNVRSSIVNGYERRNGRDEARTFSQALHAAEDSRRPSQPAFVAPTHSFTKNTAVKAEVHRPNMPHVAPKTHSFSDNAALARSRARRFGREKG